MKNYKRMKIKCFLLTTCLLFMLHIVSAKDILQWGVRFGFDVPTNKKDFTTSLAYKRTLNYNVGLQLRVGERFFGQAGLDYHINKCQLIWKDTLSSVQHIELGYLALPIEVGFHIVETKKLSFRANAGLQYRVLVRLSKNDIGIKRKDFQQHNLDAIVSLGLDVYSFTFDVGYRKSFFHLMPTSAHYRDMFTLSLGLIF